MPLRLATRTNSPPRDSERTAQLWLPALGILRAGSFLSSRALLSPRGFRYFHGPSWALFTFPSRYLYAIGVGSCLALEVGAPQLPAPYSRYGTQGTGDSSSTLTPTGLSPSTAPHSSGLRLRASEVLPPCNPTSPASFLAGFGLGSAGFGRPYSRHPVWFLFLRVLRCFTSPRSRSGL